MKKIEKLHHAERSENYSRTESSTYDIIDTVNALVDAHNDPLETHTVKEEHPCSNGVEGTTCNNSECQPTTPEKKCGCTDVVLCKEHFPEWERNHPIVKSPVEKPVTPEKKLPTSSYEVTCGRCEKSIKHSCGRV